MESITEHNLTTPRQLSEQPLIAPSVVCWWDWPHDVTGERLEDFMDLRRFLEMYAV